jgi:hypothetical protein
MTMPTVRGQSGLPDELEGRIGGCARGPLSNPAAYFNQELER